MCKLMFVILCIFQYFTNVRVVFMFGKMQSRRDELQQESDRFHDVIQEDFIDTYRNLTYKCKLFFFFSKLMVLRKFTAYIKYIIASC